MQKPRHVRARRRTESRQELLGYRCAADPAPAFEDEHSLACVEQVVRGDEAVMARTYDDCVVLAHARDLSST